MKKKDMTNYISKQALDTWEELLDLRVKILEINPKYLKMSRHALPATWPFTFYNSAYEKRLLLDRMCVDMGIELQPTEKIIALTRHIKSKQV